MLDEFHSSRDVRGGGVSITNGYAIYLCHTSGFFFVVDVVVFVVVVAIITYAVA